MRHFARFGLPFSSYFTVDIVMVGNTYPTTFLTCPYFVSVIVVHTSRSLRTKYSSSYPYFHVV